MNMKKYYLLAAALFGILLTTQAQEDKYLWLEEIDGEKSLEYVEAQNKVTFEELSKQKDYQSIYDTSLEIYNSTERIAYPTVRGNYVYNFWQDKDHVRGIWRRSSMESYASGDPVWETLLDIDALSEKDDIKWVFKGSNGLYPDYNRFLVQLSKGGGDALVIKEFDVNEKRFIEDGFSIGESKGRTRYIDENTLIVATDFGEGTMTDSGYPKQVKLWKRGTPLKDAQLIFEGESDDAFMSYGFIERDGNQEYTMIRRSLTTFSGQYMVYENNSLITLDLPEDAELYGILSDQIVIQLKSDWEVNDESFKTGTLISLDFSELLKGTKQIKTIIEPDEFSSISEVSITKNKLIIDRLTNVISQLYIYSFNNGNWSSQKVNGPDFGTISIIDADNLSDQYFFNFQNFITPSTLYQADAGKNTFKPYKSLAAISSSSFRFSAMLAPVGSLRKSTGSPDPRSFTP